MGAELEKRKPGRPKGEDRENIHFTIRRDVVRQIRALAARESRPLSRQVELLLERALA